MDYDVERPAKRCSVTDREFAPGETYYSVLLPEGDGWRRADYSAEAWTGPPEGAVGWWKLRIPDEKSKKNSRAPNDVMLRFFDELAASAEKQDMRYVLALLLVRRRVMRHEDTERTRRAGSGWCCTVRGATKPTRSRSWCPSRNGSMRSRKSWAGCWNEGDAPRRSRGRWGRRVLCSPTFQSLTSNPWDAVSIPTALTPCPSPASGRGAY